ncbi:hypothetical protein RCO28_36535 [Streptomyces sp. LHD-70]|uniref:hypothetical protein n=1 Tax=Streptomyces sp. LHD-70 TaxID=3072140 RepID=UPI00280C563F|nr:hypothetical protein [Streptomyces sp. LHD-70]MDQ8707935.1 hypothetical protein [Streptomyces sp. LHD-70]
MAHSPTSASFPTSLSPLCATAALVPLRHLADLEVHRRIDAAGHRGMEAIHRVSLETTEFRASCRASVRCSKSSSARAIPHPLACWFVSSVLDDADTERACAAVDAAFAAL